MVFHPQFLALVDKGQPTQHKVHGSQQLFPGFVLRIVRQIMAYTPGFVMVFNNIGQKADTKAFFLTFKAAALIIIRCGPPAGIPAKGGMTKHRFPKVKHRREVPIFPDKITDLFIRHVKNFSYGKSVVGGKGFIPHLAQKLANSVGMGKNLSHIAEPVLAISRVVGKGKRFFDIDDGVNAESSQSLIQPPVDHGIDFLTKLWVFPV